MATKFKMISDEDVKTIRAARKALTRIAKKLRRLNMEAEVALHDEKKDRQSLVLGLRAAGATLLTKTALTSIRVLSSLNRGALHRLLTLSLSLPRIPTALSSMSMRSSMLACSLVTTV